MMYIIKGKKHKKFNPVTQSTHVLIALSMHANVHKLWYTDNQYSMQTMAEG